MDPFQEVGNRIKQIRILNGLNQTSLGKLLGNLATSTISAYEKGLMLPQEDALARIAELGGVTVSDVYNGSTNFDEKVGNKASQIEARRSRVRECNPSAFTPTAGDVRILIDKLDQLKGYLSETTEKLIKHEEDLSIQVTSEDEKKLLAAFRLLPDRWKRRMIEDAEEWVEEFKTPEHKEI